MCKKCNIKPKGFDLLGKGDVLPKSLPKGVSVSSFVQPEEIDKVYASHSAFILASDFEPWGVVLLESCIARLPIICTGSCGAVNELYKGNGFVVAKEDVIAFAKAMFSVTVHGVSEKCLDEAQKNAINNFSAHAWANRCIDIAKC